VNVTTIDPAELPSLPLDERKQLPTNAGVYFVVKDDTVLYIGQAVNLMFFKRS